MTRVSTASTAWVGRSLCATFWATVGVLLVLLPASPAEAQCDWEVTGNTGGQVVAVARIHPSGRLLVSMGSSVRIVDASNPDAPGLVAGFPPFSFPVLGLKAPAVKIAAQPGTGRAYVLQKDGDGVAVQINARFELVPDDLMPFGQFFNCVDVVADGSLFYAVEDDEVDVYDTSAFTLNRVSTIFPRFGNHVFDRAVKVGNILWVGFHEENSVIYGISGFDMSNPAAPQHVATSLNNVGFDTNEAGIVAMTSMGSNLVIAYKNRVDGGFNGDDWFRIVSVSTPAAPAWRTGHDSGGGILAMSSISTYLHLAMQNQGLAIWDIETSGAAVQTDEFDASWLNAADVWCTGGTDYVAAGVAGLATMDTANPFDIEERAVLPGLPAQARIIRASGREPATVAVLDARTDSSDSMLRTYTTNSPGLLVRGSLAIGPGNLHSMELYVTPAATYACVGVGNTVEIIDISSNLFSPQRLNVIQVGAAPFLMSTNSGRLYVFDHLSRLHVIDMATPAFPVVRSTTGYGGSSYTCMTSWNSNNDFRLALGNSTLGLWILDTSNMALPQVQSIWNPAPGYAVHSIHAGNTFESPMLFYVNSSVPSGEFDRTYAMEVLNISNLVHPTSVWRTDALTGGDPGLVESLHLTGNSTNRFLIGVESDAFPDDDFDGDFFNRAGAIKLFDITNTSFPVRIEGVDLWRASGQVASYARGLRVLVAANEAGVYELTTPTQWRPAFVRRPRSQVVCYGEGDVVVDLGTPAVSASPADVTYQWYRDGAPLANGPTPWGSVISGATGTALQIASPRREDGRHASGFVSTYRCNATNACGATPAFFSIRVCLADLNCDDRTDVFDLLIYLDEWFAGDAAADRNDDGNVGVFDLLAYLDGWFAPC